jgi:hypothetical protein
LETRSEETAERGYVESLRVITVAGIGAGVILVGVGSRLAMFILRLTSPVGVIGVTSDDGFVIGRFTPSGTYNLFVLGASVGIIGASAYLLVSPWLIGPQWFRRFTTGAASAAVVGSMLIHAEGVDFTLLGPTWLAVGLFIALPGVFGLLIGSFVDRVGRPGSWTANGRWRWLLPVLGLAGFPQAVPVLGVTAVVLAVWVAIRSTNPVQRVRTTRLYGLVVRAVWLSIALAGLFALIGDVREII